MTDKLRINIYITKEVDEKLTAYSEKLGLSKGKVAALALQSGLDALSLAVNPDWRAYFEAMIRTGKPVKLPDGTVVGSEEDDI